MGFIFTCKRDTKLHATLPVTVTNSANHYQDAANVTFVEQNITFVLQRAEYSLAFNRAKMNINIILALIAKVIVPSEWRWTSIIEPRDSTLRQFNLPFNYGASSFREQIIP